MSDTLENPVVQLKLLIDEEKNKVLFAEAGKDFVDVLFSLLTLSMGTIVRLIEKYKNSESIAIGCFNNIYASVVNMEVKHFRIEACSKQMLLFPRSLDQEKYQNLKLRIDDSVLWEVMSHVIQTDKEGGVIEHTSFIIFDDLQVVVNSVGLALNVLKDFGYTNFNSLVERIYNVNVKEVVLLLECLFTSDTPLTDTFLNKSKSIHKKLSLAVCEDRKDSEVDPTIKLHAYVNKKEGNILYVECGEDFVDLLFTFLAMPLQSVWETSVNRRIFGCIGNLCKSCRDLSVDYRRESKCVLPDYYKCQKQLLDVVTFHKPPTHYSSGLKSDWFRVYSLSNNKSNGLKPMVSIDSKFEGGFVKKGIKFMITDDLIIKPLSLTSSIGFLKEKHMQLEDVELQVIIVRSQEAIRLLDASLVTLSALSTSLLPMVSASTSDQQSLFLRKPKTET